MTRINPAGLEVVLCERLSARRKPPAWLSVGWLPVSSGLSVGILTIRWGDDMGDAQAMHLAEDRVIDNGGPDWIAKLIGAKRRERMAMLEEAG